MLGTEEAIEPELDRVKFHLCNLSMYNECRKPKLKYYFLFFYHLDYKIVSGLARMGSLPYLLPYRCPPFKSLNHIN